MSAQYASYPQLDPTLDQTLLAKAPVDECFNGVGQPITYPDANGHCATGVPKTNESYVWGLTKSGPKLFFGTAANVLCGVLFGYLEVAEPVVNSDYVCERAVYDQSTTPATLIRTDGRTPSIYAYDLNARKLTQLAGPKNGAVAGHVTGWTDADTARLKATSGIRSAGSLNNYVIMGGLSSAGLTMFVFDATDNHLVGSTTLAGYSNIRKWLSYGGALYAGVGVSASAGGGGAVLRWNGPSDPLGFTKVGITGSEIAELVVHEGRIFGASWPSHPATPDLAKEVYAGLYMSPPIPPGGFTTPSTWEMVWKATDYEPDPVTATTYGTGALASFDGYLYWGTMHVPGRGAIAHDDYYPDATPTQEESNATFINTLRSIAIFRGKDFASGTPVKQIVYGESQVPTWNATTSTWVDKPTGMGHDPLWGPSGFGNIFNNYTWTMDVHNGSLYIGTMDWSYLAFGQQDLPAGVLDYLRQNGRSFGADLLRIDSSSKPGVLEDWAGLGNVTNYGIRTMVADDALYLGTANPMNLNPQGGWELVRARTHYTLALAPAQDINKVGTSHTVTATLSPSKAGVAVNFTVTGANPTTKAETTNAGGVATFTYTGTKEGTDTIRAVADVMGYGWAEDKVTATATKTWDATASTSWADSPPLVNTTTFPVKFTTADVTSGVATLDLYMQSPGAATYTKIKSVADPAASGTIPVTVTAGDGDYRFYTVSTDKVGNVEAAPSVPDSVTKVDTTLPTSSVQAPALVKSQPFPVSYTAADVGSGVATLDLYAKAPGATGYTKVATVNNPAASGTIPVTASAGDGDYAFYTLATDKAGNVEAAPSVPDGMTKVDTKAPVSTADSPALVHSTSFSVTFETVDLGSGVATLDLYMKAPGATGYTKVATVNNPAASGTIPVTASAGDGDYAFYTLATDKIGNAEDAPSVPDTVTKVDTKPSPPPPPPPPSDTTAPTVTSVVVPTTLTGPATVTFSEPVHGLTAGGAAIVVTGTSTVVPTTVTCLSGTAAVGCGSTFTRLTLAPKTALVPGQHYTVRLLAGAVKDAAGNPLVAKSRDFRGSVVEQESSRAGQQTWARVAAARAFGGSYIREHSSGATASWTFTGPSITWWTVTGPDQGRAAVWVDGTFLGTVSNYATKPHYKVARTFTKLGNRTHTIRIVVRGEKGARAATGRFVGVDAFSVGRHRTNSPAVTATWQLVTHTGFVGNRAMRADLAGETFAFTFRGTGITWFTEKARDQGKVAVFVDGAPRGVVDNYARRAGFGVMRSISRLTDKVHTLTLVVLGQHHAGATGSWVTVDQFKVS